MPASSELARVARAWCFTCFRFDDVELETFCPSGLELETALRYICFGLETCPETGKLHMQGYCELRRPLRGKGVKTLLGRLGAVECNVSARRATREAAVRYCKKGDQPKTEYDDLHEEGPNFGKNARFYEAGSFEEGGQGARNDLRRTFDLIKAGAGHRELIEDDPTAWGRYFRAFDTAISLYEEDRVPAFRKLKVSVFWGKAGVGKSALAERREADLGQPPPFRVKPHTQGFPFHGYRGQSSILIDDFCGNLPYLQVLNVLDGYRLALNTKFGERHAAWQRVYITSNEPPTRWYSRGLSKALDRRLHEIIRFDSDVGVGVIERDVVPSYEKPVEFSFTSCDDPYRCISVDDTCNEVGCNTDAPRVPAAAATSPPSAHGSPPSIDDPEVLAAIADILGDAEFITPAPAQAPSPPCKPPSNKVRRRKNKPLTHGDRAAWAAIEAVAQAPAIHTGTTLGGRPPT